jgi:hypothetical protein
MNHEPELVDKDADKFTCQVCGTSFDSTGAILDVTGGSARKRA